MLKFFLAFISLFLIKCLAFIQYICFMVAIVWRFLFIWVDLRLCCWKLWKKGCHVHITCLSFRGIIYWLFVLEGHVWVNLCFLSDLFVFIVMGFADIVCEKKADGCIIIGRLSALLSLFLLDWNGNCHSGQVSVLTGHWPQKDLNTACCQFAKLLQGS